METQNVNNKLIYQKMIAILKDVETIGKNKKNTQQNYSFRGIDDMYNALHGLFAKHEIFITSEVLNEKREERQSKSGGLLLWVILDVKFTCYATDGSFVCSITKGEAMDSGDKASNKAMSTALKYFLMQTFLIPTEEKLDTEYDNPEPIKKEKAEPKKPTGLKATPDAIKKYFAEHRDPEVSNFFNGLKAPDKLELCNKCNWDVAEMDVTITRILHNQPAEATA